jgi:hypothetical protein
VDAAAQFARAADVHHAHLSPYFSPNSAMAPDFTASSKAITRAHDSALARISRLTMRSTAADLVVGHRRLVGEVEARAGGVHQRALLLHVAAEHFAQGLVHEVGGGVVAHRGGARGQVDLGLHGVADGQLAELQDALVAEDVGLDLLRVVDLEDAVGGFEQAAVADLAAGFGVERRVVEHHHAGVAQSQFVHLGAVLVEGDDGALRAPACRSRGRRSPRRNSPARPS